jgi:hypothetical protein
MRILKSRGDKRRWSRRLIDDETRAFVDSLDETSEVFRTASGEFQLRGLALDVFAGEATTDVRWLKGRGVDGDAFYHRELAPSWEGLTRTERAEKIDRFIELSHMLGRVDDADGRPPDSFLDLVSSVHLKVLLLAWAYDRTYSYMDQLFNGPLQYQSHRYRLAGGRFSANGDGSGALG